MIILSLILIVGAIACAMVGVVVCGFVVVFGDVIVAAVAVIMLIKLVKYIRQKRQKDKEEKIEK